MQTGYDLCDRFAIRQINTAISKTATAQMLYKYKYSIQPNTTALQQRLRLPPVAPTRSDRIADTDGYPDGYQFTYGTER